MSRNNQRNYVVKLLELKAFNGCESLISWVNEMAKLTPTLMSDANNEKGSTHVYQHGRKQRCTTSEISNRRLTWDLLHISYILYV